MFFGYRIGYLEGLAVLKPPTSFHHAIDWLDRPQWALAVSFVVLVAATLQASVMRRSAAVLAAGAAVFALAEAAVMIFASAALALVGVVRVVRLRGRERFVLAGALVVSALLVVLAGGPTSDALFGRGGTAGLARVAWEPVTEDLLPFQQAGPALVVVGIVPLTMVGAIAAYRRRSWGLGFLAAAGSFGLLEAEFLQSPVPANDIRMFRLAQVVAIIGALSGVGALVGALRGARQLLATVAVVLLVFLPTSLPRATSNVHLALGDLAVDDPSANNSGRHYRNRTTFGAELEANWEIYAWLARSLPTEARLLTLNAFVSASAAGIASPRSGRDLQVFQHGYPTWVYRDALRFLHQDDLADIGISHLHVTDPLAAALAPSARRLLDDPDHFRLLVDMRTVSGIRHRVFEVLPSAGTTSVVPASYRFLRRIVPPNAPVSMLGTLTWTERRELYTAFADHDHIGSSYPLGHDRGTRIPRIETLVDLPDGGVVVLADPLNPTALGVSRDSAIWTGYGMRAYDLAAAWSPVWRIGRGLARLPEPLRPICESAADGLLDLRLLGEPGTTVVAGLTELTLTGLPQEIQLSVTDCGALTLGAHADVAPFAQLRPHHSVRPVDRDAPIAGLGFDGGVEDDRAIVNVWYRNPRGVPFVTGTELRLYEASPLGVSLPEDNSNPRTSSLRWWRGPVALLHAPEQNARIEFDARRLELNGERGGGSVSSLMPGRTYLLTLNIAGVDSRYGLVEIQHIVPLVRIVLSDTGVAYEVFSGIVTLEHHKPGTILSRTGYDGGLAEDPDLMPR